MIIYPSQLNDFVPTRGKDHAELCHAIPCHVTRWQVSKQNLEGSNLEDTILLQ